MRCTSCGTENEPDSRFCGGCGAKLALAPAPSRLAPTAKIPDDAVYPPASSLPTGQRPVSGPTSIPPGFNPHAPASIPPTGSRQPTPVPQSRHPTPVPQESFSRAVTPAMQTPPPGALVRPPTASQPPTQQRSPVRAAASMGESMPMPARRPVGLMVAILVIDLGLAAAGAVMLGKGLSAKKARKDVAPAAKTEVKSDVTPPPAPPAPGPTPAATPAATAAAPPAAAPAATAAAPTMEPASATASTLVGAAASDAKPEPKTQPKTEPKKDTKSSKSAARAHAEPSKTSGGGGATGGGAAAGGGATAGGGGGGATGGGGGGGPVTHPSSSPEDPYGTAAQPAFDLAAESSRLASQSNAAFARCTSPSVHGTVKIAYHVTPDGSVEHAMAVENTTGDDAVADCLTTTISTWRYSPHSGQTLSAVRPFNYP